MAPSFLPWHRRFLLDLEEALRRVDSEVTLPYWDWTRDRAADSAPWTADLLGGDGRRSDLQVTTGPFAHREGNWTIRIGVTEGTSSPATSAAAPTRSACRPGATWKRR
ncbi:hypothetical protein SHKM778_80220 [Streptomyces sp. KM77-8]|uniref:Tyrosinase copper-binding domain-containing protein n=1 Tax=Streptomyces haneummycinicus TaxID=3074435 RepID=A0AAT9HW08_9ACTN